MCEKCYHSSYPHFRVLANFRGIKTNNFSFLHIITASHTLTSDLGCRKQKPPSPQTAAILSSLPGDVSTQSKREKGRLLLGAVVERTSLGCEFARMTNAIIYWHLWRPPDMGCTQACPPGASTIANLCENLPMQERIVILQKLPCLLWATCHHSSKGLRR